MELCDTNTIPLCFSTTQYHRQPYDLSHVSTASESCSNLPHHQGYPDGTYLGIASMLGTESAIATHTSSQLHSTGSANAQHTLSSKERNPFQQPMYANPFLLPTYSNDSMTIGKVDPHQPPRQAITEGPNDRVTSTGVKMTRSSHKLPTTVINPTDINETVEQFGQQQQQQYAQVKAISSTPCLSQWDVNDPKLPKIRQFDVFTMWPQGECRYAYQKSGSEGARRHASGWAMRNTNNHNSQILKKSCLGVLLCTSKNCSLAMRPAICDKARRRQEGRPCCLANCTGRIYIQPCRGHGGYPVTHFWRESSDTVYFQAKGTHDHVRPDLKPVRDTAARRRRQMQLDKQQQHLQYPHQLMNHSKSSTDEFGQKTVRGTHHRNIPSLATNRKRPFIARDSVKGAYDFNASCLSKFPYTASGDSNIRRNLGTQTLSKETTLRGALDCQLSLQSKLSNTPDKILQSVQPIFPSSPTLGSSEQPTRTYYSFDSSSSVHLLANQLRTNHHISPDSINTFNPCPNYSLQRSSGNGIVDCNSPSTDVGITFGQAAASNMNYRFNSVPSGGFYADGYLGQSTYGLALEDTEALPNDPFISQQKTMHNLAYPTQINTASIYKQQQQQQQLPPPPPQQQLINFYPNNLTGANSESTSGGLNASWSTPSPPTGGSSSFFGELRNNPSGIEDQLLALYNSHGNNGGLMELKDTVGMTDHSTVGPSNYWWTQSTCVPSVTSQESSHSVQAVSTERCRLTTPPNHHLYDAQVLSRLRSPDLSLMTPTAGLMSSSTPLSEHSQGHAMPFTPHILPNGSYMNTIPILNLNSSDSRSSNNTNGSQSSSTGGRTS